MITDPVSSSPPPQSTGATASTGSNTLGKDAFLKLLTAQLANQDPLQPVDNQSFIAQLAQFSSLEQMQGVASRLDSLLLATNSSTQLNAASLAGKSVTFRADGVDVVAGQATVFRANPAARASITAVIQDSTGRTVRTLTLGAHDPGAFDVSWDGLDDQGNAVPPGHYSVKMGARGADGSNPTVDLSATGRVQEVRFGSDGAQLVVGSSVVKLSDVSAISSERTSP